MSESNRHVGFVPGLALLLSALALFLIGFNAITGTPSDKAIEEMMEQKFESLSTALEVQFNVGMKQIEKVKTDLRRQRVAAMREIETAMAMDAPVHLQDELRQLDAALSNLEAALGGGAPTPQSAPPEAAPDVAPETGAPKSPVEHLMENEGAAGDI